MILAFSHPCLVVPDLEVARVFYEKMFGFSHLSDEGWSHNPAIDKAIGTPNSACKGYMMRGHNCLLELFEFSSPEQSPQNPAALDSQELGIRHLAFYVDDVETESRRFVDLGGSYFGEPTQGVAYLRDPFGNIIELCEIPNNEENPVNLPGISSLNNTDYGASS